MTDLLQEWVSEQAWSRPDATAVVMKQQRLSYSELEDSSNRLANLLNVHGCRQGDRICLLQKKSPLAVISILGILKVGCIYVPVDSSQPAARVASILDACEPRFLLADESAAELLDQLIEKSESLRSGAVGWMGARGAMANRFNLAFTHSDLEDSSPSPLSCKNTPQSPAHILFTSGSTGAPKGVVITHSNVIHFVTWGVEYFGITHSDRLSGQTPFHFDLSTFDIFGTFCAGAELHLVPPETALLPNKLADFIRNSELSQWFSVPSLLTYMAKFDVVKFNDFPALKRLLWCGEVLPTPTLIYLMERLPHVAFTNLYGPTEATIASSYHTLAARPKHGRAAVPIGRPCRGENLLVLDRDLRPIPPGETGELYIQGVGLSPGYWEDPERTRKAFLPHPSNPAERIYKTGDLARIGEDGLIYFLGRADTQIKSRGYRIELGEIESALNTLSYLRESAVVAIKSDGFDGAAICCAYVPARGSGVVPVDLRRELQKTLPTYMIPSRWRVFDALPKNANGKTDRRKLGEMFEEGAPEQSRLMT